MEIKTFNKISEGKIWTFVISVFENYVGNFLKVINRSERFDDLVDR